MEASSRIETNTFEVGPMAKKPAMPTKRRNSPGSNHAKTSRISRGEIAAAIAKLDQTQPPNAKVATAIALFKSWLTDESGYDEKAWPKLKKALEMERKRAGARRLFDG
jgi:hypothetical protein